MLLGKYLLMKKEKKGHRTFIKCPTKTQLKLKIWPGGTNFSALTELQPFQ
jgi:hypothetical protein